MSSASPCPLASDFQVESIFKSTWKFRSGPIASRTCWEVPHHPLSKTFKMNSRPPRGDLNLPDSRFHLTKLEIPRTKARKTIPTSNWKKTSIYWFRNSQGNKGFECNATVFKSYTTVVTIKITCYRAAKTRDFAFGICWHGLVMGIRIVYLNL